MAPIYEWNPAHLLKIEREAREKVLQEQREQRKKLLEKAAFKLENERKAMRDRMLEAISWRK